jgi:TolB-like protein/Tfp pilus assembly protein PilF
MMNREDAQHTRNPKPERTAVEAPSQGIAIAVLPFENLSGSEINDYFARGFVEELMTDLSQFQSLRVISSYTARKLRGRDGGDALEASRELGIRFLLRGALIRRKDHLRITPQLIDVETGGLLWAEKFDAPTDDILEIQERIVRQTAGAISIQIDRKLLTRSRKKPETRFAAYDYWLQGMDLLRQGSTETDQRAKALFEKALAIDPHFSRAYTGISLSYFNDWSCQVPDRWDEIENNAYRYAMKAVDLDGEDHVARMVIGRILIYRREFDLGEAHIDKALALNPNDADNLAILSHYKALLGKPDEGEALFKQALTLNPYRSLWYFTYGAVPYFVREQYEQCIETALKGPLTEEWFDLPAFVAASYAHLGDAENAGRYLDIFVREFQEKMTDGRPPSAEEIIDWIRMANPFRYEAHSNLYVDGLLKAGLAERCGGPAAASPDRPAPEPAAGANVFREETDLWRVEFDGRSDRMPGVKGFYDIARLLASPEREVHCTELMGTTTSFADEDEMVDEKAKAAYAQRMKELKEEIAEAEANNDLIRSEKLKTELDGLTDHLSRSVGLSGRSRKLNSDVERARSAVTWRIRSAIKKIGAVNPSLARHLDHSITTGTFCAYQPERAVSWQL